MLKFEPFAGSLDDWGNVLEQFPDREIFQTPAWLRFLAESQSAKPVIATLRHGTCIVGCFAGMIVHKLGFRILGSPFVGWTTPCMGIRLRCEAPKCDALAALASFAFRELRCSHIEFTSRAFSPADVSTLGFESFVQGGFEIDLRLDEAELLSKMDSDRRRCIRKASKEGIVIEQASDAGFVDDYFAQLEDVFAKKSLVPTYDKRRVRLLVSHLFPTGMLLLLRARDSQGRCIGTGIFPAMNRYMYFWGGASWRQHNIQHPNESIQWYAMRYWKSRGIDFYDMCGGGEYKQKYGGRRIQSHHFLKSKYSWLAMSRNLAFRAFKAKQRLLGWWQKSLPGEKE
jgi:hypothetical protein